jgi:hypothetical protein
VEKAPKVSYRVSNGLSNIESHVEKNRVRINDVGSPIDAHNKHRSTYFSTETEVCKVSSGRLLLENRRGSLPACLQRTAFHSLMAYFLNTNILSVPS